MDPKLQNLLHSFSPRAAWIIIGSGTAFWLVSRTGILIPPASAPPQLMLFWFYAALMLSLASGLAVIGAVAVLLAQWRGARASARGAPPESGDAAAGGTNAAARPAQAPKAVRQASAQRPR